MEANLLEKFGTGRVVDTKDPDGRVWRIFLGDEHERKVDLSAIEPYARVISHGGNLSLWARGRRPTFGTTIPGLLNGKGDSDPAW